MNLRSHHLWHVAIGEPPPGALPRAHDTVRVGMALGLPAIDALVADGTGVGPLKYCLGHQSLLVPVEAGTFHRWGAAHSDCVPGTRTGRWVCDGYGGRGCTGLWVTRPEPVAVSTTPAAALHEALSRTRDRMRAPRGTPVPQRREVCRA
ncbi:hypothetical protein GCM10010269_20680 [Streptomyces humidus]|uniref:Uncharacterized protein n=2 Tax=Streptomyces TaxID=1883 RepID=A0A918L275_9ACTN|nr:hypothetical protein SMIR_42150 [Streptomyces mirabilis]GAQ74430.1 hypothetical protein T45_06205 [Streptomyces turgidiscabies]GGR81373.1 hypothetical protein GCM10010269_20680 [Streptomyces humidus]